MRYIFFIVTLFINAQALAASCTGVSWQSSKEDIEACLNTGICDDINDDSPSIELQACRSVSPCHNITKNSLESDLARCREATIVDAKLLASEVVTAPSRSTIAQGGDITIRLPDEEDASGNVVPKVFTAERDFIGGGDTSIATFNEASTYDDEDALINEGRDTIQNLSTNNDSTSNAYQTVMSIKNENPPLPISDTDPILTRTNNIVTDTANTGGGVISDCRTIRTNYDTDVEWDEGTEHFCFEMVKENFSSGECEVEREINTPFQDILLSGTGSKVEQCGANCLRLTFDRRENNKLKDDGLGCKIFPAGAQIVFAQDMSVTSANVITSHVDDHVRINVNGNSIYQSSTRFDEFLAGTRGCESDPSGGINKWLNNWFFTNQSGGSYSEGQSFDIEFLSAIGNGGEYIHVVELRFDKPVETTSEITLQTPEGCYDDLGPEYGETYEPAGYCTANQWECLESKDGYLVQGDTIDKSPFVLGGDPWCERAIARNYNCDPFLGNGANPTDEICFQDEVRDPVTNEILQEKLCYTVDEVKDIENKPCDSLQAEPNCTVKRQDCEWEDELTGKCYNWRYTYECSDPRSITINNAIDENICDTSVPCAGGDCDLGNQQTNDDFVNVMAQFSMLQGMIDDRTCEDPTDPSTCTIWPGEYEYCSFYPVGNDCCEGPGGVSIAEYVSVTMGMANLDAQIMSADILNDTVIKSGWETVRQPVTSAYDAIATPLSNAYESIAGNITGDIGTDGATKVGTELGLDTLKQEMTNFVAELMPDGLQDVLFDAGTDALGNATGDYVLDETLQQGFNVLNGVMAVYTAYQVANLVINLATQCDDNEMDAGLKIEMRQCVNVNRSVNNGSDKPTCEKKILGVCLKKRNHHCCYNTILARIVMEQAIPMLGKTIAVDKNDMTCEGLSLNELAAIDWSAIDLSEWIGLMGEAGVLPQTEDDTSLENMTGSGQLLNSAGRDNTVDRMRARQSDGSMTDTQRQIWDQIKLNEIDCTSPSRPAVCSYLGGP